MQYLVYGIKYVFCHKILNKNTPLICGLVVNDKCNLQCRHCRVANRGKKDLSFEEAKTALNSFYKEGGRCLYLEGGEPFIWHDGPYKLEDIVEYSRKIGFYTVIIYTNGTIPLKTSANTVFISLDGLQKTHDDLRGETFHRIMQNIQESEHSSLYVNYTINSHNKNDIRGFCDYLDTIHQIRGIFFYFHTPYYGYDDLYLEPDERNEILLKLLDYKNKYKILNSKTGLKSALNNDWKRPLDICRVYENGKMIFKLCRNQSDVETEAVSH